ncbi:unnamed protein product [Fraxinus pennsylvanica]|uniref:Uncharacterized protein n=1 Tax=Fraxinus pennsylvanica TaxID=56036 RepID=A0AAD2DPJ7_9LAMI|nr:unnamed protein product [Fraxinus pennsylvanica]
MEENKRKSAYGAATAMANHSLLENYGVKDARIREIALGLHNLRLKLPVDAHKAPVLSTNVLPTDSDWRDHGAVIGVKDQLPFMIPHVKASSPPISSSIQKLLSNSSDFSLQGFPLFNMDPPPQSTWITSSSGGDDTTAKIESMMEVAGVELGPHPQRKCFWVWTFHLHTTTMLQAPSHGGILVKKKTWTGKTTRC